MRLTLKAKFFGLAILSLIISTGMSHAASNIADSTCDPAYMESLEARAWLEAQREITQNQNLIAKPDSVLAYSCFDEFAGLLATKEDDLFSRSTALGTAIDSSIRDIFIDDDLLYTGFTNHLRRNFNGEWRAPNDGVQMTLRGGRGDQAAMTSMTLRNSSYNCDVMQRVWKTAQCADFIERTNDGFLTFKQYETGDDRRDIPASCGPALAQWNDEIGRSGYAPADTETPWYEDQAQAYSNLSDPAACGDTSPIDTGIMAQFSATNADGERTTEELAEKFCIQPGCYYDSANNKCAPKI